MQFYGVFRAVGRSGIVFGVVILFLVSHHANAADAAVRAFLGVRSLRADLPEAKENGYYAVAVGQFEGGKLIGYALPPQMGMSTKNTPGRFVEFAWRTEGEGAECVLVIDGQSRATGRADFVLKFKETTQEVHGTTEGTAKFRGFRVLSYIAAIPAEVSEGAPSDGFEQTVQKFAAIALLYQEFSQRSDYLQFVEELKASKQ